MLRNKQFELDKGLSFNQFSNWLEWATIWVSSGKPIEELSEELKMGSVVQFDDLSIETRPMEQLSNGIQMGSGYVRNQDL